MMQGSCERSFSVVVCTDGRAQTLGTTLSSLLHLDYDNFEVCIVSGPTADSTSDAIAKYNSRFKVASCAERNLAKSRNVGISIASGEIVAFIDDDAVPEPEWLRDLAHAYDDPQVGGAGGFVFDHTGVRLQYGYATTDRLGRADLSWTRPAPELNFPFAETYPHLIGTNASFRRTALLDIGGFDEEYEYFLDETDLCCRLIDHGYRLVQLNNAFVHHKFAPSSIRDAHKKLRSWYPLVKNRVYFALQNGSLHHDFEECIQSGLDSINIWRDEVEQGCHPRGFYTLADKERFHEEALYGLRDGIYRGLRPGRKLLQLEKLEIHVEPFHKVEPLTPQDGRQTICFVSQDYPPNQQGGIARHVHQLATCLGALGHNVHVITRSVDHDSLDYENHVWVHRRVPTHTDLPMQTPIPPHVIPQHIWNWSQTALRTVQDVDQRRPVSVVYAPLWDCEGIAFLADGCFPLITSLHTTLWHWLDSYPERLSDPEWMHNFGAPVLAMEALLMNGSQYIHANSNAIVRDIERLYQVDLSDRVVVVPHGLQDWQQELLLPEVTTGQIRLLFVGRLEHRKGVDVLLDVASKLLRDFPDAVLDVVGDDSIPTSAGSTYRTQFESQDLFVDIRHRVRFHGFCDEDRLRRFYASCDIFVAPSRYESFGLVALEAMMFGKPVVACRAGGIPEVVVDGITGLLVEPGDGASLEEALSLLLRNAALRKRMGHAGRARYESFFTDRVMIQAFESLLSVVNANADRPGGKAHEPHSTRSGRAQARSSVSWPQSTSPDIRLTETGVP